MSDSSPIEFTGGQRAEHLSHRGVDAFITQIEIRPLSLRPGSEQ